MMRLGRLSIFSVAWVSTGSTGSTGYKLVTHNIPSTPHNVEKVACNSWVPLCRVTQVPKSRKSPLGVEFAGRKVSVVQTPGGFQVFEDFCPHRGACLSAGVIEGSGGITCPYHGMEFDVETGVMKKFLGEECREARQGSRMSLNKFPVNVYDGLVWTNLGDTPGDFTPVDSEDSKEDSEECQQQSVSVYGSVDVDAPVFDLAENLLDPVHISYVHKFGNSVDPVPRDVKRSIEGKSMAFGYRTGRTSVSLANVWRREDGVLVHNSFVEPLSTMSRVSFGPSLEKTKTVRVHLLPLDENTTRMHWGIHRNFAKHPIFDGVFRFFMEETIKEDQWILDRTVSSSVSRRNNLTEFDWTIIQYRKHMIRFFDSLARDGDTLR